MAFLEYRPTTTLYQYCSLEGFRGITTSKQLRLTGLKSANDPRKLRLGHAKFIAAIEQIADRTSEAARKRYLHLLADQLTHYADNARAYCACFSMARDELPMWATYGAQHGGIAIGFRPTALFGIPARVQLVEYVDQDSNEDYRELVGRALREIDTRYPPESIANTLMPVVDAFRLMTAQKHHTWRYEKEVRVIHAQMIQPPPAGEHELFSFTGELPNGWLVKWKPPLARNGRNGPIHYLEFPFGRFKRGLFDPTRAIAELIVGPKCATTVENVVATMMKNGFKDFVVVRSDCQLR